MVDRANIGKNLFSETVNPSVLRVKGSSRKRRCPVVSPQLQDGIANLLPEAVLESPVWKFLRQYEYSDSEETLKGNKSENESFSMEKKQELDEFKMLGCPRII